MSTLEEEKKIVIDIINKQMELTQKLLSLDNNKIEEFNSWYKTSWHYNKLQEFQQLVKFLKERS